MTLNIVCTSKPVDGLLYYSYEYMSHLNAIGLSTNLVIICHRDFTQQDYIDAITRKYIHYHNVIFDSFISEQQDITLVMGRSMITLSWQNFKDYTSVQQASLKSLFSSKVISVYSENHPAEYPTAVSFYAPSEIIDICDTEVYPNGVGEHFEKRINFSIFRPHVDNVRFRHLFMGTNNKYYASAEKSLSQFPSNGILTYSNASFLNDRNNNIFAPIDNLLGMFDTYVYTKETFDPAPRLMQECRYFGKNVIYHRDSTIVDGGSVYWKRDCKDLDVTPILRSYEKLCKT